VVAINVIVSCTNRKRYPAPASLTVRNLGGSDVAGRLRIWKARLRQVPADRYRADRLYIGDHWAVARQLPSRVADAGLTARLWVCSAGYGLIRSDTLLKPYQATFAPGTDDYVVAGTTDRTAEARAWWQGVCALRLGSAQTTPRTLAQLAATQPRTPMLVALSLDYLDAVADDLEEVLKRPFFREHLAIVSCGTVGQRGPRMANILPCDGLMAGALGGTLTSINVRIARHLLTALKGADPTVERLTRLARSIPRAAAPPARQARSDRQVLAFIRSALRRTPRPSRSRLLREYRDAGLACEQGRFANLYSVAAAGEVAPSHA
jgi:hypothetical protein